MDVGSNGIEWRHHWQHDDTQMSAQDKPNATAIDSSWMPSDLLSFKRLFKSISITEALNACYGRLLYWYCPYADAATGGIITTPRPLDKCTSAPMHYCTNGPLHHH